MKMRLSITCGLLAIAAAVASGQQEGALRQRSLVFVSAGEATQVIVLDSVQGSQKWTLPCDLSVRPLTETGGVLSIGAAGTVLWRDSGTLFHGGDLSFATLGSANEVRWALAVGESISAHIWFGSGDPWTSPSNGEGTPAIRRAYADTLRIEGHPAPTEAVKPLLIEYPQEPQLFVWNGRFHMAAFGDARRGEDRVEVDAVCVAAVEPDSPNNIPARWVAPGRWPVVVVQGTGVVLAAFRSPSTGIWPDYPLDVYRSTDLVTWTQDTAMSTGLRVREGYAMTSYQGRMWVATTEDLVPHAPDLLPDEIVPRDDDAVGMVLYEFDPERSVWERKNLVDPQVDRHWRSREQRCWLLPSTVPSSPTPQLIYRNAAGDWIRRLP